jgi:hypothetical protein
VPFERRFIFQRNRADYLSARLAMMAREDRLFARTWHVLKRLRALDENNGFIGPVVFGAAEERFAFAAPQGEQQNYQCRKATNRRHELPRKIAEFADRSACSVLVHCFAGWAESLNVHSKYTRCASAVAASAIGDPQTTCFPLKTSNNWLNTARFLNTLARPVPTGLFHAPLCRMMGMRQLTVLTFFSRFF